MNDGLVKKKLRSGSSSLSKLDAAKATIWDFSTLQVTLITRFNDREAKLTFTLADQLKNMFKEINDKNNNLNSKLCNIEERLNKCIDEELSSICQKFTINLKTHSVKLTEFEARLVASSNTNAVIDVWRSKLAWTH